MVLSMNEMCGKDSFANAKVLARAPEAYDLAIAVVVEKEMAGLAIEYVSFECACCRISGGIEQDLHHELQDARFRPCKEIFQCIVQLEALGTHAMNLKPDKDLLTGTAVKKVTAFVDEYIDSAGAEQSNAWENDRL